MPNADLQGQSKCEPCYTVLAERDPVPPQDCFVFLFFFNSKLEFLSLQKNKSQSFHSQDGQCHHTRSAPPSWKPQYTCCVPRFPYPGHVELHVGVPNQLHSGPHKCIFQHGAVGWQISQWLLQREKLSYRPHAWPFWGNKHHLYFSNFVAPYPPPIVQRYLNMNMNTFVFLKILSFKTYYLQLFKRQISY